MIYKRTPKVQEFGFSSIESFKGDIEETINYHVKQNKFSTVSIIMSSSKAISLLHSIMLCHVNGVEFHFFPEYELGEVISAINSNDVVVISILEDGQVFVESDKYFETLENEFCYVESDISDKYIDGILENSKEILVFTIGNHERSDNMKKIITKGIDLSYCQQNVDYAKVKKAGYTFAMLKLANARDTGITIDEQFENHYKGCIKAGINVGVYVYSLVTSPEKARKCAKQTISYIKNKIITYPVCFDV